MCSRAHVYGSLIFYLGRRFFSLLATLCLPWPQPVGPSGHHSLARLILFSFSLLLVVVAAAVVVVFGAARREFRYYREPPGKEGGGGGGAAGGARRWRLSTAAFCA